MACQRSAQKEQTKNMIQSILYYDYNVDNVNNHKFYDYHIALLYGISDAGCMSLIYKFEKDQYTQYPFDGSLELEACPDCVSFDWDDTCHTKTFLSYMETMKYIYMETSRDYGKTQLRNLEHAAKWLKKHNLGDDVTLIFPSKWLKDDVIYFKKVMEITRVKSCIITTSYKQTDEVSVDDLEGLKVIGIYSDLQFNFDWVNKSLLAKQPHFWTAIPVKSNISISNLKLFIDSHLKELKTDIDVDIMIRTYSQSFTAEVADALIVPPNGWKVLAQWSMGKGPVKAVPYICLMIPEDKRKLMGVFTSMNYRLVVFRLFSIHDFGKAMDSVKKALEAIGAVMYPIDLCSTIASMYPDA